MSPIQGGPIGKLFRHADPQLDRELENIYRIIHGRKLDGRTVDLDAFARELGPHFPENVLLNLERYFTGARKGKKMVLRGEADKVPLVLEAMAGFTADYIQGGGARLTNAGVWTNATSSRKHKQNIRRPPKGLIERLRKLRVLEWEHKRAPGVKRLGPLAEDWARLFGLGYRHTTIADDVAALGLLGVQFLLAELGRLQKRLTSLEKRNARLSLLPNKHV